MYAVYSQSGVLLAAYAGGEESFAALRGIPGAAYVVYRSEVIARRGASA